MTGIDTTTTAPAAQHRGRDDLPFVDLRDGSSLQLLQVDLAHNVWIGRQRFRPGTRLLRHRHTGPVTVATISGRWRYLEYPDVNTAGSFLFEPAGSVHTFDVPADNDEITEVLFTINGANLNLDDNSSVVSVFDAHSVRRYYLRECRRLGIRNPNLIVT